MVTDLERGDVTGLVVDVCRPDPGPGGSVLNDVRPAVKLHGKWSLHRVSTNEDCSWVHFDARDNAGDDV